MPHCHSLDSDSTIVLHDGPFGLAVASVLAAKWPHVRIAPLMGLASNAGSLLDGASHVALAMQEPLPQRLHSADIACGERGITRSLAWLDGATLFVGQTRSATAGACYACYQRRVSAHAHSAERAAAFAAIEGDDARMTPHAFIVPLVEMAAESLALELANARSGYVREIDLSNGVVTESFVLSVHGCERCGSAPNARRYVDRIRGPLAQVLE